MKIHALSGRCDKSQRSTGPTVLVPRNRYEETVSVQRKERLATVRMPLDQFQNMGQRSRFGPEDADPGASTRAEVEVRPIMVSSTSALVDEAVGLSRSVQYIPERRERRRRQRFGLYSQAASVSAGWRLTSL